MPLLNFLSGVLKNKFCFILLCLSFVAWGFEATDKNSVGTDGVSVEIALRNLPAIELYQALKDGFRSEVVVYVRLMKKAGNRFPWIDENRQELTSVLTIWYDRPSRYYFVQDAKGQISGQKTFEEMLRFISVHHFSFSQWQPDYQPKDWYIIYRADLTPIRLMEPFQIFLVYPFFRSFRTPWVTSSLEAKPQWPR